MPIKFSPMRDRVLLAVEPEPPKSSLLLTPSATESLCRFATVVAVGPEVRQFEAGERVLASITAGVETQWGVVVSEQAILAHVG